MITIGIIISIVLIILSICLPQLLYILIVGFTCYIICKILNRKQMGYMILILCILISLNIIIQEIFPIINKLYPTKNDLKESIIEEKDDFNKFFDYISKYPLR